MNKALTFLLYFLCQVIAPAQNIYSAIHLHRKEDIKHGKAKKIEFSYTYYGQKGPSTTSYTQLLNKNNLTIERQQFENNKLIYRHKHEVDSLTGLIIVGTFERWDPVIGYSMQKTVYHYDQHGFHTGVTYYNPSGQKSSEVVIKVNETGYPVQLANYDENGNLQGGYETAEYLMDQNRYITTVFSADGKEISKDTSIIDFEEDYKFNSPGRKFNPHGDLIETRTSAQTYTFFNYKYDSKGNWIEEKEYEVTIGKNGKEKRKLEYLRTRKIEYWPE